MEKKKLRTSEERLANTRFVIRKWFDKNRGTV